MAQQEPGSTDAAYDPAVALKFFKSAGKPATIGEGETIFGEKERASPLVRRQKMYLLVKGDVALVSNKKTIGRVRAGEIFGEMAVISDAPRSAAAVAKTECRVIALDDKEFEAALGKHPEFAVMLMSVMILRLRNTIAQLKSRDALSEDAQLKEARAFDPEVLSHLVEGLADDPPIFYQEGAKIVTEGQKGLRM
ncbi:MAG: cyclic nucleotide-binding domain-containing protein, partial [Betaproteobacteria bacterium]|nr:cyclic nucleotide-binding domain-containing protein [Betaproteobacteria bacterium]